MNLKKLVPTYKKILAQEYDYRFTVFTPVFNCEKSIQNVHKSLINQTYKNFQWLVINDGSTDNSHLIIEQLIKTTPLNVHYVNNSYNQNKMACFLEAISLAKGELLLTFDGDDECYPNALEIFDEELSNIPDHNKDNFCAVTGLCEDQYGNRVGDNFPSSPFYSDAIKLNAIFGVRGEKWGFTKTSVLRGICISDDIKSKGLIPESLIWNLLAKEGYQTKYINKTLRIYNIGVENSLSSTSIKNRAFGSMVYSISMLNWFYNDFFWQKPQFFFRYLYVLLRASKYLPYSLSEYLKSLDSKTFKIIIFISWPFRKLTI